ncbi:MAG: hypothetical protein E7141_05285 [Rikenellaceae bacterium]|nr:hypothetical protein [Rikenellaceae bacterium]
MKRNFLTIFCAFAALCATVSCSVDKTTDNSDFERYPIRVSQVASSSSCVTISWLDDKGDGKNYTLRVYKDEECTDLYQEYSMQFKDGESARFSVPYLKAGVTYYICVENVLGYKSNPFEVETTKEYVRREILSQDFDLLFWGYDYINSANCVVLSSDIKTSSYLVDDLYDARLDSQPTTSIDENGGLLFKYRSAMIEKMGFKGWSGSEARILPGYIKLGSAYNVGVLKSPAFDSIEDTDHIDISFDACVFASSLQANGGKITASVVKSDGSVVATKDFNMSGVSGRPEWKEYKLSVEKATADCHLEISTSDQVKMACIDNIKVVRHLSIPDGHVYGYTYDKSSGKPISGVAVSDGFSVVSTDKDGMFTLRPHPDSWYIYYSVPADCEVVRNNGSPRYFILRTKDVKEYNFELRKMANGKEEKFALFALGDPQVSSSTALKRFTKEAVPAIKEHATSIGIPCYGITLGDIVSTSDKNNTIPYMEDMHEAMQYSKSGMPIFQVMGNHDNTHYNAENILEPDESSSTFEIKAQRAFESKFGPVNFSFNRGDVHIVGMRDIVYQHNDTSAAYTTGFLPEQYEWLKQDLALVPKDKMVVLCVHIPLYNSRSVSTHYVKQVHQLLKEFKEAHIISGHTHLQRNYEPTKDYPTIYEHNMGTVCGTWWKSNLCGCGTPNGYGVFIGENGSFTNWYYMGYNEGMNSRDYQMRLYRGNAITGAEKDDNTNGKEGYYAFNYDDSVILANVFNADSKWKIEVYEDGEYTGDMTLIKTHTPKFNSIIGDGSFNDPYRAEEGVASSLDMWTAGFHLGVLDRYDKSDKAPSNGSWTTCSHMYKYTLKNKDAKVKVVVIDRFGNRYESDKFVDYNDNNLAAKPLS